MVTTRSGKHEAPQEKGTWADSAGAGDREHGAVWGISGTAGAVLALTGSLVIMILSPVALQILCDVKTTSRMLHLQPARWRCVVLHMASLTAGSSPIATTMAAFSSSSVKCIAAGHFGSSASSIRFGGPRRWKHGLGLSALVCCKRHFRFWYQDQRSTARCLQEAMFLFIRCNFYKQSHIWNMIALFIL